MKARLHDRRRITTVAPPAAWRAALPRLTAPVGSAAWPVDIVLVEDARIATLNRDWRGHDEITDVLSFSYLETMGVGEPDLRAGARHAAHDLWRGLGDDAAGAPAGELVIAPGFVGARCAEQGWDEATEWALLTAHGLLHLVGWTHGDAVSTAAMRGREARLLRAVGFPHPMMAEAAPAGTDARAEGEAEHGSGDQ